LSSETFSSWAVVEIVAARVLVERAIRITGSLPVGIALPPETGLLKTELWPEGHTR
jgi:hypothetical protein